MLCLGLALLVVEASATLKLDIFKSASTEATLYQAPDHINYVVEISIGTPPQIFYVSLDTGSTDLWVPDIQSNACKAERCAFGAYDELASSTYRLQDYPTFNVSYGTGAVNGSFIEETVCVANFTIKNMRLGLGDSFSGFPSPLIQGILGIGYGLNEPSGPEFDFITPMLVDLLKSEGLIERRAYSLWLDSLTQSKGSLLFGAIDSSKYSGPLIALPFKGEGHGVTEFFVDLTSLSRNHVSLGSPDLAMPCLLDSGTTLNGLPDPLATALFNELEVVAIGNCPACSWWAPCSKRAETSPLAFGFGGFTGPTINVLLSELISPSPVNKMNVVNYCRVLVTGQSSDSDCILGDSFLRSAYVVYDLDNNVAAIGQTNFHPGLEDIKIIPPGTTLPGVSKTATVTASAVP